MRPARDADAEGVIALIAAVFAEYPGCVLDVVGEEPGLTAPASAYDRFWVAEREGVIVGSVGARGGEEEATVELVKCYVARGERGRGLGRALVERVEAHARAVGARRVVLWSDTRFETAHRVYRHLGYRPTGRRRALDDRSATIEDEFAKRIESR